MYSTVLLKKWPASAWGSGGATALTILDNFYRQRTVLSCMLVAVIVMGIDFYAGKAIRFPILYVLPVGLAVWQDRKAVAYILAILLPLARLGFHLPWHETQSLSVAVINAGIRILALFLYAYLIGRILCQKRILENKINVLTGILPICASCKRIRNEKNEYEQIEEYITMRTEASFSHGICPECAKKLYPGYFKEKQK